MSKTSEYLSGAEVKRFSVLRDPQFIALAKATGRSRSTVRQTLRGLAPSKTPSAVVIVREAEKMLKNFTP